MSLHTQVAHDRESLRLIESEDGCWPTFDDTAWSSFTSTPSPTSRRRSSRSRQEAADEAIPSSPPPSQVSATRHSPAYSPIASTMHIPSSSTAMLIHHPSMQTSPRVRNNNTNSNATTNATKRPMGLNACRSDDTPTISNIVEPPEVDRLVEQEHDSEEEELADDSRSSSNDDITVSRINVSDTDLLRSESPGCLRLTEHGLKALEMQNEAEPPSPALLVVPQAFTAGRMRHGNARRPRPGDPKTPVRPKPTMHSALSDMRSSYNEGRDPNSHSSRVLAPCPEDCSTTFTPSPTSSPQHQTQRRGGGLLSSLRGRRCADESDASSVTPLCDPDKLVSRLSAMTVSDPPAPPSRRRRLFGGLVGMVVGGGDDSQDGKPGRKDKKSGKNSLSSSNKSTASQRYLEQVSAQEAKERQKMTEERERKRIEQKRRAYLQQQRAKEMAAKRAAADDDAMTRPSSSRTAATVQSSLFDEDSHLFGSSRVSSRSMRSQSAKSKATASSISSSSRRESSGVLREFGELLFADTCPATFEGGSVASSTAMTTAPNTRTNDGTSSVHDTGNHQNALLPPCVVCHSAERTHVATPCFHFLYCQKCAKRLPTCVACHQPAKFRPISM